jgi:hypothetical protein
LQSRESWNNATSNAGIRHKARGSKNEGALLNQPVSLRNMTRRQRVPTIKAWIRHKVRGSKQRSALLNQPVLLRNMTRRHLVLEKLADCKDLRERWEVAQCWWYYATAGGCCTYSMRPVRTQRQICPWQFCHTVWYWATCPCAVSVEECSLEVGEWVMLDCKWTTYTYMQTFVTVYNGKGMYGIRIVI